MGKGAEGAVPTLECDVMVGTLRFAHPTPLTRADAAGDGG